ncbi:LamG-like jellyroll fold domain-containing protein [uncultured Methanomethylovorans sp.]|uniref:LamG-like jellyroll fold domain-containing protein n=1 Tax=uncultured Methanomethylovorans sp. TaxID=183759 RepID=UPI002AA85D5C|nr:LamG-like jellyroll fold domain-containing protein [uncultured Methanomethylovorans sp.]
MYPKEKSLVENCDAVSELIGEILLTGIAVIAFSTIAVFLLSPQGTIEKPIVDVDGWVDTNIDTIWIRHAGGDGVQIDNIKIYVDINNDRFEISPQQLSALHTKPLWELGDTISLDASTLWGRDVIDTDQIYVVMVHVPSNTILKSGMVLGSTLESSSVNYTTPATHISPISMWNFDEGSGSILHDIKGDNDGTIYGATWTTGIKNNSLSFNGNNNYVAVPHDSSLNFTNEISILFWMNCKNVINTNAIVGKGSNEKDNFDVFVMQKELFFEWNDSNANYVQTSGMSLSNNIWYMIGITFDKDEVRFYKNGNFIESRPTNGVELKPNTNSLWIGRQNAVTSNFYYRGRLDELTLYNKVLSDEEIMNYYNATVQS